MEYSKYSSNRTNLIISVNTNLYFENFNKCDTK